MKLGVYSVLDKAIAAFNRPIYFRSRAEAVRSFADACSDEKSDFARHSTDYVFMYLGEFDDSSGSFSCVEPERVISAVECLPAAASASDRSRGSV